MLYSLGFPRNQDRGSENKKNERQLQKKTGDRRVSCDAIPRPNATNYEPVVYIPTLKISSPCLSSPLFFPSFLLSRRRTQLGHVCLQAGNLLCTLFRRSRSPPPYPLFYPGKRKAWPCVVGAACFEARHGRSWQNIVAASLYATCGGMQVVYVCKLSRNHFGLRGSVKAWHVGLMYYGICRVWKFLGHSETVPEKLYLPAALVYSW